MFKAKSKTYGSVLIFLAMAVAAFFASISLIDKLEADSDKVRDQRILLSRLDDQKSQIGQIRADYQEQKKEMEKIEKSFLDPNETVDFVIEIERIAQKAAVKLETKTVEKSVGKGETLSALNYQLIATGKFGGAMRFLEYLENIRYNIKINGLKLTAVDSDREESSFSSGGVKMIVDLEVYISE